MKVGINMGNSLDAMDKSWGKMLDTDHYMWSNPRITEDQIRTVKEMGFTSMRIPVSYYNHLGDNGVIDPAWLQKVKLLLTGPINMIFILL